MIASLLMISATLPRAHGVYSCDNYMLGPCRFTNRCCFDFISFSRIASSANSRLAGRRKEQRSSLPISIAMWHQKCEPMVELSTSGIRWVVGSLFASNWSFLWPCLQAWGILAIVRSCKTANAKRAGNEDFSFKISSNTLRIT